MKKLFVNIVYVLMVSLFLLTSTGISLVKHYCNTSKTEHLQLFSEDYKCKTETEVTKKCCCSKHHSNHTDASKNNIKKSNCCNNTYQYLKIAYHFDKETPTTKLIVEKYPFIVNINTLLKDGSEINDAHNLYHPPPLLLVGTNLIHFIHSIKIPSPESC